MNLIERIVQYVYRYSKNVFILFYILISIFLIVLIHEIGHFLLGEICGFKFEYAEVFGIRIDKKLQITFRKKINAKTRMTPIGIRHMKLRVLLYLCGGIIVSTCLIFVILLYDFYHPVENRIFIEFFIFFIIISDVIALVPYYGSDGYWIKIMINKKEIGLLLIPYYLENGISPGKMPSSFFEFNRFGKLDKRNKILYRMSYFHFLENNNTKQVKLIFLIIRKELVESKYLSDKCELFFYYNVIEKNFNYANAIIKKIENMLIKSQISSKKRILMTCNRHIYCSEHYSMNDMQTKISIEGVALMEENLINKYINFG